MWNVTYHDGSANAYRLASDGDGATFEYIPITPAHSSTGTYSGGEPRAGRLDARAVEALWHKLRELESTTALHTPDRNKGTGAFGVRDASGERSFIIERGPLLLAFDAFLAELR